MSVGRQNSSRTRQAQIVVRYLRNTLIKFNCNREDNILMIWQKPVAKHEIVLAQFLLKAKQSPFYKSRKLCEVQGLIIKVSVPSLLIECGSPVTFIRPDLWKVVRDLSEPIENEPKDFQGVTRDGLRILGLTKLEKSVCSFRVKQPLFIAYEIVHKFILGYDSLTEHICDILNLQKVIQFENKRVPYTIQIDR